MSNDFTYGEVFMVAVAIGVLYLNTGGLYLIIDGAEFFDNFNGFPFSHLKLNIRNNVLKLRLTIEQASFYMPDSYL